MAVCFDTNIFIDSIAPNPKYIYSEIDKLDSSTPLIYPCIVDAEIYSYLSNNKESLKKRAKFKTMLDQFKLKYIYLNKDIVDNYIQIDSWYRKNISKFKGEKSIGKNDMWIACTSFTYNAMLFSNEKAFKQIMNVKFNSKDGLRFFEFTHVEIQDK